MKKKHLFLELKYKIKMAVPKKRSTKSKRNNRRMHQFIKNPPLTTCSNCGQKVRRHHMCKNCGYYKGEQVVDVMAELTEKQEKEKKEEIEKGRKEGPLNMENLSK